MHDSEILSAIADEYATRGNWRAAQLALQVAVDAGAAGIQVRCLLASEKHRGGASSVLRPVEASGVWHSRRCRR